MITLDDVDIQILNYLQQNGRLNHKELSSRVHKAPTTVYTRIHRLEEAGLISGYVALLAPDKIRLAQTVYTQVQLRDHTRDSLSDFEQAVDLMPEVMECYHLTGDYDFLLRIVTRDVQSYHEFLMQKLFGIGSVSRVDSAVVMRQSKKATALPLKIEQFK